MPTISFRIDSIRAERYSFEPVPHLNISMNIMFGKPSRRDGSYAVEFVININCSPPIASISIKGSVFISPVSAEESRKIEADLSKQPPPQPLIAMVISYNLPIIALLSRELGIPPPVQLPLQPPAKEGEHRYEYHT